MKIYRTFMILVLGFCVSLLNVSSMQAKEDTNMAHNIYSDPDLSNTSGDFTGFLIDFKTDTYAEGTYWALCNWSMNPDSIEAINVEYASAYAGLQFTEQGPIAITSFWDIAYKDEQNNKQVIHAKRVFPKGETATFDNEGEGSQYLDSFNWEKGKWYRMYLNCYDDKKGETFIETWFEDIKSEEWTLFCRYDTGLKHSYMQGRMSQFMENYAYTLSGLERNFYYKNIYVREKDSSDWIPITGSVLSVDTWWGNKKGTAVFDCKDNMLTGTTIGKGEDQYALNEVVEMYYTFNPDTGVHLPN